jgi:isoleucyl-tRNA synthetase
MDFKKTLIMPQTEFEMRGNLAKKDPAFIDELSKLRQKIMESKKGELYILHDGPPYANGNIHVGHALNKILKDIVARDQLLRGRPVD